MQPGDVIRVRYTHIIRGPRERYYLILAGGDGAILLRVNEDGILSTGTDYLGYMNYSARRLSQDHVENILRRRLPMQDDTTIEINVLEPKVFIMRNDLKEDDKSIPSVQETDQPVEEVI